MEEIEGPTDSMQRLVRSASKSRKRLADVIRYIFSLKDRSLGKQSIASGDVAVDQEEYRKFMADPLVQELLAPGRKLDQEV